MKITLTANERGLSSAITPGDIAAPAASLAGLPRVNHNYRTPSRFSLVLDEALELGKAPGVESAAGFPMIDLDPIPDIREILKHDSGTCIHIPDNRTGDNVVTIPSEALFTSSKASKMPLGRLRTFGLQFTSDAKYTFDNFLHVLVTMETVVRTNSRSGHSQVYADSVPIRDKLNIRQADNYVEVKPILTVKKVSRSCSATHSILGILGKIKNNLNSSLSSGEIHNALFPIQSEGMQVVSRRAKHRLGASCFQPLLLSGDCRLNGFSSLLPGLNMKVRNETGEGVLTITIRQAMKCIGVAVVLLPSNTAYSVERLGELLHRFIQSISLLFCRFEKYTNCSIHNIILPYSNNILQEKEVHRNSSVA